ncbi:MAG: electron transfer flavoprotein subunit beta/FixA family protein [Deltaproteobacteria bacterium]|jgi:electron transfer flavoprotein beta subunit|nr:electron transfer flavoprotein subunit beta/FixA family protein [Deltaproteobacteria bacterium]OEU60986.1 MAG: electron transfer flavoprotein subunit beta [Desulfobacterales bacterium C00003104]
MNILVCIKQVPYARDVRLDPETHTLVRDGVESIINPFDMYAIEEGLRLKESCGGKVTVMSMGPPQVEEALRDALSLGVDDAVLLSDRAFAGADTLATSYTLAMGAKKIGNFDLILCGKQTVDGDTGQVGPGLAVRLDIPFVAYVRKISSVADGKMRVERIMDDGYEVVDTDLPALLTLVKEINEPRVPSLKNKMRAKKQSITVWNAADIGADTRKLGLAGSATQVTQVFKPERESKLEWLEGSVEEQTDALVEHLRALKVIG